MQAATYQLYVKREALKRQVEHAQWMLKTGAAKDTTLWENVLKRNLLKLELLDKEIKGIR